MKRILIQWFINLYTVVTLLLMLVAFVIDLILYVPLSLFKAGNFYLVTLLIVLYTYVCYFVNKYEN